MKKSYEALEQILADDAAYASYQHSHIRCGWVVVAGHPPMAPAVVRDDHKLMVWCRGMERVGLLFDY